MRQRFAALCAVLVFLGLCGASVASAASEVWVSPVNGSDANSGASPAQAVQSLTRAAAVASALSKPVTVNMQGGTYTISPGAPLSLTGSAFSDIAFSAVAGQEAPIVSGGQELRGWTAAPAGAYGTAPGVTVWQASTAGISGAQARQLYVDGVRAARAQVPNSGSAFKSATVDNDGYIVGGAAPQVWTDAGNVEFVFTGVGSPWTECRCTVDNVTALSGNRTRVFIKQPCMYNAKNKPYNQGVSTPAYIENAGPQFLAEPGQWYFYESKQLILYVPLPGQVAASLSAVMPTATELVAASAVSGVTFSGIKFMHATWLGASEGDGYVEQQSGALLHGTGDHTSDASWIALTGNLVFEGCSGIAFSRCELAHLGAAGIYLTHGAHDSLIEDTYFHDISGAAVQIGDYNTWNITDPLLQERNNSVRNCIVDQVANEYHGNVALSVGYTAFTTIDHNTIGNLTYGGVSIGWGWSREVNTYASNNTLSNNYVHHYKTLLNDGGGLYALGPQQGSVMSGNFISNQTTSTGGGLYPDEGSAYWHVTENVVSHICAPCEWLHVWIKTIHDIDIDNNYADTSTQENHGTNCPETNNTIVTHEQWPQGALAIMKNAGVVESRSSWSDVLKRIHAGKPL